MYKSARYYFKTKSNKKSDPVKRRNYIGLDSDFRELMDNHIVNVCARREMKPADGFVNFMDEEKYVDKISTETIRLKSYNFEQELLQNLPQKYKGNLDETLEAKNKVMDEKMDKLLGLFSAGQSTGQQLASTVGNVKELLTSIEIEPKVTRPENTPKDESKGGKPAL